MCSGDYLANIEILLKSEEELPQETIDYTDEEYGKLFLYKEG